MNEAGHGDRRNKELGRLFGVSGQAVRKWLQGDAMPRSTRAAEVARVLGVRRAWLMDGEMPMRSISLQVTEGQPGAYGAGAGKKPHKEESASISLSVTEFRLLRCYRRLPRELQENFDHMLHTLSDMLPEEDD